MKTFFVTFKTKSPEAANHIRQMLLSFKLKALTEEGNVFYEIFNSEENDLIFFARESWSNEKTMNQHMEQDYIKSLTETAKPFLTEPFTVVPLKTL